MSSGMISIGVSGITAAQLGLLATEHNVTNASTPGYTRQRTVQATNIAVNTGAGAIGQGVHVQTIERMYDRFVTEQVNTAQTKVSEIDAYYAEIKQIDNLLADPSAGLTPALQEFFSGVQQVAANPSLLSARQSMISSAETLVNRFQSLSGRLDNLTEEVNGKLQDTVASVNSYASQIAELNQRIIIAESSYDQPANDLLDQRDYLVNQLNTLVGAKTSENSDGSINVFVGTGQQLVVGSIAMEMTAAASSANPEKIVVGLKTAAGTTLELPESLISGGALGGLVQFRTDSLEPAQNELGRVAASMALTMNAQQALGQDLMGNVGVNTEIFGMDLADPGVMPNARNNNAGSPVISAAFVTPPPYGPEAASGNFYTKLTTSDYRLLNIDGTHYSLTRLSDGQVFGGATTALNTLSSIVSASEGVSLALAGGDAAGNSYLIRPTQNAAKNIYVNPVIAADTRTIAAAAPFRTSATSTNTGTGSITAGTMVGATPTAFSAVTLPTTITYSSVTNSLSFSPDPGAANILVKVPNGTEVPASTLAAPLPYQSGMTLSLGGMSFSISGSLNNNDSFTLKSNIGATTDSRNALSMGKLQTQNTMSGGVVSPTSTLEGGKATFQTSYAEMVARNGIKTRELSVTGKAQQSMLEQATATRDSLSGVNLDEEAANLIKFQQAYQASAKLLEVGKTLFDTLLQIR